MIQAGDQVGQYKIIRRIGSGGMATVYLALHPRLNREVALKVMHDAFQQDNDYLVRFEREARIVAGLEHPHIIPVYDFSEHAGKPYLVMKYVRGRSLKSLLDADKRLPSISDILRLLEPIGEALDYAHSKGILHRDVKPSNIMLDENDVPYLADFGLARIAMAGESTLSQDVILGTPQYISPEQARGKVNIDGRTDIYALGIILYQLIVGDVPFSADTPFAIIHDHIYRPLPDPQRINPDVTPGVAAVLRKALAKAPNDRYPSARVMLTALKEAAEAGGMDELSPEHVSRASTTLALLREQEETDVPSLEPLATPAYAPRKIESPLNKTVVDNSSLITEYRYRHGWVWTVGGILMFLVSFIAIGAVGSQIDGQVLASRVRMSEDTLHAQIDAQLAEIPDLTLREAGALWAERPQDSRAYHAIARTFWEHGRAVPAMQAVAFGQDVTEHDLEYTLVAAALAHDLGAYWPAVMLYAEAVHLADTNDMPAFEVVRSMAGSAIFELTGSLVAGDQVAARQIVANSLTSSAPDMTYIAFALTWLALDEPDQAASAIIALDERDTGYEAEYEFLLGELAAHTNNVDEARDRWQEAVDRDYTPHWIREVVTERLATTQDTTQQ